MLYRNPIRLLYTEIGASRSLLYLLPVSHEPGRLPASPADDARGGYHERA